MTSKECMLTAYRNQQPHRVPISPEIWDATSIEVSGKPFYKVVGPLAKDYWWKAQLKAFEYFDCDAWIVPEVGNYKEGSKIEKETKFLNRETLETKITYKTSKGNLCAIARTTDTYVEWLIEHPIKNFPEDMEKYKKVFFVDPWNCDVSEIKEAMKIVGEKGLVTPDVGELFVSFLGTIREGGIGQAIYDIFDYNDYCKDLQKLYIDYMTEKAEMIIKKTNAEAIFLNSNYSAPPIISPSMYREWDKPVLEAVSKVAKNHSVLVHLHQHGYVIKIMEDIIDAGIDVVGPLIPPPQGDVSDLSEVKRFYGDKIALKGHVDPMFLLNGTPQDIETKVRECILAAGSGGGYILGTADSIVKGTPFDNIRVFVKAGKKYGRY